MVKFDEFCIYLSSLKFSWCALKLFRNKVRNGCSRSPKVQARGKLFKVGGATFPLPLPSSPLPSPPSPSLPLLSLPLPSFPFPSLPLPSLPLPPLRSRTP